MKKPLIIIIVLLIVFVGGYLVYNQSSDKDEPVDVSVDVKDNIPEVNKAVNQEVDEEVDGEAVEEVTEEVDEQSMRKLIEIKYPDFRDYENQESFAGHAVVTDSKDGYFYAAYMELGSGVPVVKVTCFKVDDQKTVIRVGSFPGQSETLGSHEEFDPVTCGDNIYKYEMH